MIQNITLELLEMFYINLTMSYQKTPTTNRDCHRRTLNLNKTILYSYYLNKYDNHKHCKRRGPNSYYLNKLIFVIIRKRSQSSIGLIGTK